MENKKFAIVLMFAPEKWGWGKRFAKFYSGTFNYFPDSAKRAVSGAVNHFTKAMVLKTLSAKLKPNLEIDLQQLEKNGYTKAENSKELSAVIETIFTELYSSIDCTTTIVYGIYNKCRGLPKSTSKMFKNIRNGKVCNDFPEALRSAFQEAVWFDELLSIRAELTHLDLGQCDLDKNTGLVRYIHTGIKRSGRPLVIDDIFQKVDFFFEEVNKFLGRVFFHLNSLLKDEPIPTTCGIFNGRVYTRHVIPSMTTDFNSGTCDSYRWFELPDNPKCPFADSCGAYASAKS